MTFLSGVYRPDVDDPEHCNPFAAMLWELTFIKENHYHPIARQAAAALLEKEKGKGTLPFKSRLWDARLARPPSELLTLYDFSVNGQMVPAMQPPKPYTL